jgi:hypothetical protein
MPRQETCPEDGGDADRAWQGCGPAPSLKARQISRNRERDRGLMTSKV